nr:4485_t:CDS:2 [Entrophospora candida]
MTYFQTHEESKTRKINKTYLILLKVIVSKSKEATDELARMLKDGVIKQSYHSKYSFSYASLLHMIHKRYILRQLLPQQQHHCHHLQYK